VYFNTLCLVLLQVTGLVQLWDILNLIGQWQICENSFQFRISVCLNWLYTLIDSFSVLLKIQFLARYMIKHVIDLVVLHLLMSALLSLGVSSLALRIDASQDVVHIGDTVDVRCSASGDTHVTFSWSKVGERLEKNVQIAGSLLRWGILKSCYWGYVSEKNLWQGS